MNTDLPSNKTAKNVYDMIENLFRHFQENKKIAFIKELRAWFSFGLRPAKELADNVWERFGPKMQDGAMAKNLFSSTFSELDRYKNDLRDCQEVNVNLNTDLRNCQEECRILSNENFLLKQDKTDLKVARSGDYNELETLRARVDANDVEIMALLRVNNNLLNNELDRAKFS